ncbi:MAG TPA: SpoIIE family protein phosphatase [Bacteroidales bacterium]|nr:SpoIIE family protein phosphatase [Bacteroidales bacterium]
MVLLGLIYSYDFDIDNNLLFNWLLNNNTASSMPPLCRLFLYGIITFALVYVIVMSQTRSLLKSKKLLKEKEHALDLIEKQKSELEMREKSITDSLVYAQRIQEARLPSETYFRKHFKDSFIFLKPKDIVSGDFYWIGEKNDKVFIVAADCTGHGVPGALMSMIGIEIIEKTINEDNIEDPSKILSILNKGLEKTFSREKNIGTIIKDGMDVGLCVIEKKRKKLNYSGAFFPLYLFRDNNLIETKGDKIIIGMNPEDKPYTNHELDLQEDDIFYFFSDGYVDQFGGSENKKFMYRRFRYLLLTIHRFTVDDQKAILEENIRTWMGNNAQVDDIMVIGFKPLSGEN